MKKIISLSLLTTAFLPIMSMDNSTSWPFECEPSQEMVAKYQQQKPAQACVPKDSKRYELLRKLNATANYDDVHKSFLVQQLLFKHLYVHAWDIINPMMDHKGDKALHDFDVKIKRREIDPEQDPVVMTKKDLHHRLLTFVLTDGTQCRINEKYIALIFKPTTQNGIEGELVSTEYDFESDKPHHEQVMATFNTILDKASRMNETWVANPHQ